MLIYLWGAINIFLNSRISRSRNSNPWSQSKNKKSSVTRIAADDDSSGAGEVEDDVDRDLSFDDGDGGSCSKFFKTSRDEMGEGIDSGFGDGVATDQSLIVHDLLEMTL